MSALSSEIKTTYSRAPQSPVERASRCEVKPHRVLATACTLGGRGTRPLGSWSAGSGGVTGGRWKVEDALATTLLIGCWRLKWGRPTNIILTSARHAVVLHNTTPAYGSSQSAFPKSIPVFTACGVLWSTDAYRAAVSPSQACTTKRRTDPLTPKLPVSHPIIYRRIMPSLLAIARLGIAFYGVAKKRCTEYDAVAYALVRLLQPNEILWLNVRKRPPPARFVPLHHEREDYKTGSSRNGRANVPPTPRFGIEDVNSICRSSGDACVACPAPPRDGGWSAPESATPPPATHASQASPRSRQELSPNTVGPVAWRASAVWTR
ncbi:hypothetical protein BU26DRAFT_590909 [Trematosphaeria pertusa]|uniref:Uncharacterized protein n=1 Tax=Trematosphaeria pertusa TaxID=390896 RepID=A0A6A6IS67_9PLEO|nr:uncharacterized protein BU26DRAFT_590909 [Trematosphaeria pertusa]KAF2252450.1 hypothetical protein BU26DRAFT_590909 [Trematosphaeria pertusa]